MVQACFTRENFKVWTIPPKKSLKYDSTTFFGGQYFGRMDRPKVMAVAIRHLKYRIL